jgi:hypothetical protein
MVLAFPQILPKFMSIMLPILTFSTLLFLLVSAFFVNFSKRLIKPKKFWHNPVKLLFVLIYSANLTGFIMAGYLLLSSELEIVAEAWYIEFIIIVSVFAISTPYIYFSHHLYRTLKIPLTRMRLFLILANLYPSYIIYSFYNQ